MTWNYRVMRTTDLDGTSVFSLREVYYDEAGVITHWTANATWPQGETFGELTRDFAAYQAAFQRPVLAEVDGALYDIGPMGRRRAPKLVYRATEAAS